MVSAVMKVFERNATVYAYVIAMIITLTLVYSRRLSACIYVWVQAENGMRSSRFLQEDYSGETTSL